MRYALTLSALVAGVYAQQTGYGQCGGQGWTGPTTCVSGWTCTYSNAWYSQCLPGGGNGGGNPPATTTMVTSTRTTTTSTKPSTSSSPKPSSTTSSAPSSSPSPGGGGNGKLKWVGSNESGAEFGETNLPGTEGKDYTFPSTSTIDTLIGQGYNTFRVAFRMERMTPGGLTAGFNSDYLSKYSAVISHITSKGAYAVLDPHNYGRFAGSVITDTAGFQKWWQNFAGQFKSNANVIFDTNNEYNSMDQTLVLNLNQAAINGIRASGATSQYIFVEGNAWSGAWSWTTTNDNMKALTDPNNRIVYEMHQYLDSDSSGTSAACVSSTIGAERIAAATTWLRQNGKVGVIGEFAGGANDQCKQAVQGMINYLKANSDVWMGAVWWAAGPWWGDYMYSFEPPSGVAYSYYNSVLKTALQ